MVTRESRGERRNNASPGKQCRRHTNSICVGTACLVFSPDDRRRLIDRKTQVNVCQHPRTNGNLEYEISNVREYNPMRNCMSMVVRVLDGRINLYYHRRHEHGRSGAVAVYHKETAQISKFSPFTRFSSFSELLFLSPKTMLTATVISSNDNARPKRKRKMPPVPSFLSSSPFSRPAKRNFDKTDHQQCRSSRFRHLRGQRVAH